MGTGILYIIRNDVNDKVYIGKTYYTLKRRWCGHLSKSKDTTKKYSIYLAMRKYGVEHFHIEEIGKFEEGVLEEKEKEYIKMYNSYRGGYNDTLGGEGANLVDIEDTQLNDLFKYGLKPKEISKLYNVNVETIYIIMDKFKIRKRKMNKQPIIVYSKDWEIKYRFGSYNDCWEFIKQDKGLDETKKWHILYRLNIACKSGREMLGYKWQKYFDLIHYKDGNNDNTEKNNIMVFNTYFDKEDFEKGMETVCIKGVYHVINAKRYGDSIKTESKLKSNNRCKICNNIITDAANMCKGCYNKNRGKLADELSKDVLQRLIIQNSYEKIGRSYNVTGKTIRKLADTYGIAKTIQQKTLTGGIIAYSKELNIIVEFSSFIKAANWMIDNEYIKSNNARTTSYYISKSCNTEDIKYGFYWYRDDKIKEIRKKCMQIYSETDLFKNKAIVEKGNSIKVGAYSEQGELIESFNSATEAARWLKGNNLTGLSGVNYIGYKIVKAAKEDKVFCAFIWSIST